MELIGRSETAISSNSRESSEEKVSETEEAGVGRPPSDFSLPQKSVRESSSNEADSEKTQKPTVTAIPYTVSFLYFNLSYEV